MNLGGPRLRILLRPGDFGGAARDPGLSEAVKGHWGAGETRKRLKNDQLMEGEVRVEVPFVAFLPLEMPKRSD